VTRREAPAAQRNREPIRAVLALELGAGGLLLEVASGTGEHALWLSQSFPHWQWQPSDSDPDALASIADWREDGGPNLLPPLLLDASDSVWPLARADAILCVNMVHISPPASAMGLYAAAGKLLSEGAPLLLYGPFIEADVETVPSNLAFDASLKTRNPEWGLRDLAWLDALAAENGLTRTARHVMPANNLMLVWRKQ
jgi:hypothetical protein